MALIICTECGHKVSERAMRCPKCGAPIKPPVDKYYIKRSRKNRKYLVPTICAVVLVAVAFGVYIFFNMAGNQLERDKTIAAKIEKTKANTAQTKAEIEAVRASTEEDKDQVTHYDSPAISNIQSSSTSEEEAYAQSGLENFSVVVASPPSRSEAEAVMKRLNRNTSYSGQIVPFNLGGKGRRYRVIAYTSDVRYDAEIARDELRNQFHDAWIYTKNKNIASNSNRSSRTTTSTSSFRPQDETRIRRIKSWITGGKWYDDIYIYGTKCLLGVGFCGDLIEVFVGDFQHYVSHYWIDERNNRIYYEDPSGKRQYLIIDEDNRKLMTTPSSTMMKY